MFLGVVNIYTQQLKPFLVIQSNLWLITKISQIPFLTYYEWSSF